jgi:hypothetical protein
LRAGGNRKEKVDKSLLGSDRENKKDTGANDDDGRRTTLCVCVHVKSSRENEGNKKIGTSIVSDVAKMRLNPGR